MNWNDMSWGKCEKCIDEINGKWVEWMENTFSEYNPRTQFMLDKRNLMHFSQFNNCTL